MGTQFIDGSFRQQTFTPQASSDEIRFNLADSSPLGSTYTSGATIIDGLAIQAAPLGQVWSLLGWSITAKLATLLPEPGVLPGVGPFGKIIGGLTFLNATPWDNVPVGGLGPVNLVGNPFRTPMLPLPANSFGLSVIWDGATDTAPPVGTDPLLPPESTNTGDGFLYSQTPGLSPTIVNYALPVPVQIYPGETMQIGMWITPSNMQGAVFAVTDANYTLVIDDGQPQITTWGRDLATELAH